MIVIDQPLKANVSKANLKKLKSKNSGQEVFFSDKFEIDSSSNIHPSNEATNVGSMLFLQEIDTYSKDLKRVDEFAQKALKHLKKLQLSLIDNNLSVDHLYNLKDVLNKAEAKFHTPELEQLANDIKTRIEVEIAKIEKIVNNA